MVGPPVRCLHRALARSISHQHLALLDRDTREVVRAIQTDREHGAEIDHRVTSGVTTRNACAALRCGTLQRTAPGVLDSFQPPRQAGASLSKLAPAVRYHILK